MNSNDPILTLVMQEYLDSLHALWKNVCFLKSYFIYVHTKYQYYNKNVP